METLKTLCQLAQDFTEQHVQKPKGVRRELYELIRAKIHAAYRDGLLEGYWRGMQDAAEVINIKKTNYENKDYSIRLGDGKENPSR